MAEDNAAAKPAHPLTTFCFKVQLDLKDFGSQDAFFRSVSGLKYDTEIVDLREGGLNNSSRKLIGGVKWSNLVFKRGFSGSSALLAWRDAWFAPLKAGEKRPRLSGTIIQLATDVKTVQAQWKFTEGVPVKWEISDFDASKSEVAIETLEIAHEGLEFIK